MKFLTTLLNKLGLTKKKSVNKNRPYVIIQNNLCNKPSK